MKTTIKINGIIYTWDDVYKISGLCYEDWLHDSEGSNAWFIECLEKWEEGK